MRVDSKQREQSAPEQPHYSAEGDPSDTADAPVASAVGKNSATNVDIEVVEQMVNFSNGKIMTVLGWIMWIVIVLANAHAIVTLAMGGTRAQDLVILICTTYTPQIHPWTDTSICMILIPYNC